MFMPETRSQKNTIKMIAKKPAQKITFAGGMVLVEQELVALFVDVMFLLRNAGAPKNDDELLQFMNSLELTVPQAIALKQLDKGGVYSVGDIAKLTGLSKPATSHLVERLVRIGLVERTEDPNDRRQKQIKFSQKAQHLFHQMKEKHRSCVMKSLAVLSDTTREQLQKLLITMKQELVNHSKKI